MQAQDVFYSFTGVFRLLCVRVVVWEGDPPHARGKGDQVLPAGRSTDITRRPFVTSQRPDLKKIFLGHAFGKVMRAAEVKDGIFLIK